MTDIVSAIDGRLRALAAGEVPAREKPSAHDHGLLRVARDETARLRKIETVARDVVEAAFGFGDWTQPMEELKRLLAPQPPVYYLTGDGIQQLPKGDSTDE